MTVVLTPRPLLGGAAAESSAALRWFARLRWAAALGQILAIVVAREMTDVELALGALFGLVALAAVSNAVLELLLGRGAGGARLVGAVLVLDVLLLTGLLLAAGGPSNPFSIFYLVHVALAGLLLGAWGAWLMAGLTAVLFGLLFVLPAAPLEAHAMHMHGASSLHLQGMWVAFALAAGFVATFVSGLAKALAGREAELARMRRRAERSERLAALAAFSANAAHELGSPLATIAVAAHELEHGLARVADSEAFIEDARLIRSEVERCRGLVHDLTRRGGLIQGEQPERTHTGALWQAVREHARGIPLELGGDEPDVALVVPRAPLVLALVNLVNNAQAATMLAGKTTPVRVGTTPLAQDRVRLYVRDSGLGFPSEIMAELGEAFVTARQGEGLGLGLYLAGTLARELGGRLDVVSRPTGSEVALELPTGAVVPERPVISMARSTEHKA